MATAIKSFTGQHKFLSNFFEECPLVHEGAVYRSLENAFQAEKTLDKRLRISFENMKPGDAKKAGRKLLLRRDWDQVKEEIMELLLFEKFTQFEELRDKLLATGTASLVEGNWWHDIYWGCCTCPEHRGAGENRLGILLMRVRARISKLTTEAVKSLE